MSRRPARFTEADLVRALKTARAQGIDAAIEIAPDGTIRIFQASREQLASLFPPTPEPIMPIGELYELTKDGALIGKIYFIYSQSAAAIKIGFSISPETRLKSLKTAHAGDLEILTTIRGTMHEEHELHKKFKHLRLKGEWFAAKPDLLAFIEELKGMAS